MAGDLTSEKRLSGKVKPLELEAMAFRDFKEQVQGVGLLQRSLERGRVAHAYLFSGDRLEPLETLAKTVNCQKPVRKGKTAIDCCDQCSSCRKIDDHAHGDVHWARPESKSRVITIDQVRDLMQQIYLKPSEAIFKVALVVAADRLNTAAANAFLKTLEEPPPNCLIILVTTEPERILETIVSRCLRLRFGGEGKPWDQPAVQWLAAFSELAAADQKSLLGRYRLMDVLLRRLNEIKEVIEKGLTERSPLQRYQDVEKDLEEKWEQELKAAIEAEYRRQRGDLLLVLQWWLRDVWLQVLEQKSTEAPGVAGGLLNFPDLAASRKVAHRLSPRQAVENLQTMEQLQRWLGTNVQEALAVEVGLLKLHL
jgi:DNA polymerase-3 subunit delta'